MPHRGRCGLPEGREPEHGAWCQAYSRHSINDRVHPTLFSSLHVLSASLVPYTVLDPLRHPMRGVQLLNPFYRFLRILREGGREGMSGKYVNSQGERKAQPSPFPTRQDEPLVAVMGRRGGGDESREVSGARRQLCTRRGKRLGLQPRAVGSHLAGQQLHSRSPFRPVCGERAHGKMEAAGRERRRKADSSPVWEVDVTVQG